MCASFSRGGGSRAQMCPTLKFIHLGKQPPQTTSKLQENKKFIVLPLNPQSGRPVRAAGHTLRPCLDLPYQRR